MTEKIFVTGAGVISALGKGMDATLISLQNQKSGVGKICHVQTEHEEFPVGEVSLSNDEMSRMLNVGYPLNELRTVLLGLIAAEEAITTSGLTDADLCRAAFVSGTTVGGMDKTERHFKTVFDANVDSDSSVELRYNDCGYSTELIAENISKFKMVTTTSTACSSAANAIIFGANLIKAGIVDIALVGGSEALSKFHLNGFNTLMILDQEHCRPFDKNRQGINLGEGAAYLVLESERSAKSRNASIMAELSGYANTCDAFHQTATSEDGEGAFRSMRSAMDMAHLTPADIDYINAHGTGTPNNDETELAAMHRIWGNQLPKFSSTKGFTGHTTSASGSIESVICLLAINYGFIPVSLGWQTPIEAGGCPVCDSSERCDLNHVINNSFGFGGNDSTLIFTKYSKENE